MQEIAKGIRRSCTTLAWKFHWPIQMMTSVIALLALVSLEVAMMLTDASRESQPMHNPHHPAPGPTPKPVPPQQTRRPTSSRKSISPRKS